MTKRVIFADCSYPYWIEVAANLRREAGWEPCYWAAGPDVRELVTRTFPNVIFHSAFDALRGIRPPECAAVPLGPVDQPLFEALAWHQSIVLKMMDRMDPGDAFNHGERVRLYDRLLSHWVGVLDHFDPDVVVFATVPHVIYDYILYALCRHRGVKTVMFEPIYVEGLIYPFEHVEVGSSAIRAMYERLCMAEKPPEVRLSPASERHLARFSCGYDEAMPFYLKEKIDDIRQWRESGVIRTLFRKLAVLQRYPRYCVSLVKRASQFLFPEAPPNYLKQRGRPIEASWISGREHRRYRRAAERKKRQLAAYYARLAQPVDLDRPFVFFALHYQPERTTSPSGGAFADQVRAVSLVAKTVPEGWHVYVKEHLGQLAPFWKGELSRTTQFYDDLVAIPNVRLVPLSVSPFRLTDHARAVATIAGTVGWEAINRGRPVLALGQPWYAGCEGVFPTPSLAACREVFARIEAGYKVDHAKVRLFVHVLEQQCFRGYIDADNEKVAGVSYEENVAALTRALRDFVEGDA